VFTGSAVPILLAQQHQQQMQQQMLQSAGFHQVRAMLAQGECLLRESQ
jgi:hypothetical protein